MFIETSHLTPLSVTNRAAAINVTTAALYDVTSRVVVLPLPAYEVQSGWDKPCSPCPKCCQFRFQGPARNAALRWIIKVFGPGSTWGMGYKAYPTRLDFIRWQGEHHNPGSNIIKGSGCNINCRCPVRFRQGMGWEARNITRI